MGIISLVLLAIVLVLVFALVLTRSKAKKELTEKDKAIGTLQDQNAQLSHHNVQLSKYQGIVDVEQAIGKRKEAYLQAERAARLKVEQEIQARRDAIAREQDAAKGQMEVLENELAQQKKDMRQMKRDAEEQQAETLGSATREAARIIEDANKRAEETAGDALIAMREATHYEETAKAMKNTVRGYGDEYLVPNANAIDDLAEEFSYRQAGVELKTARARVRQMVGTGTAATCEYVEERRKQTAIHFVLDAFNGKVESILSTVKHNNYGKLAQEIRDAFSLVNHNGMAFRNARILPEYLDARLQELKWAVAVNELQLEEREEQRGIKEKIREEERARREYEKAMGEAEKEQKMLQKAMEQARKELESAKEEQREEFQQKLHELEEKLREAEEKNQRAISMARQTKRGHVYVISNIGSFGEDVLKIGLTRRLEPLERIKELGDASVPFEFDVHAMMFSEDGPMLESELHQRFGGTKVNKVNPRKEFFRVRLTEIKSLVEQMGIEVKWTMAAEAREYRETLAMEKQAAARATG